MFPIRDHNPSSTRPVVTQALIAINVVMFLLTAPWLGGMVGLWENLALYPVAVAVSALTTLFTPYLIRLSDPLTQRAAERMPPRLAGWLARYPAWLARATRSGDAALLRGIVLKIVLQVLAPLRVCGLGFRFYPRLRQWLVIS